MRHAISILLMLLAAAATSCTSDGAPASPSEKVKDVMVETDRPVEVASLERTVRVTSVDGGVLIRLEHARIFCPGYDRFAGRVGTRSGWLRVGKLDFSWNDDNMQVRAPSRWTRLNLRPELNVVIDQDGTIGRSIFTD